MSVMLISTTHWIIPQRPFLFFLSFLKNDLNSVNFVEKIFFARLLMCSTLHDPQSTSRFITDTKMILLVIDVSSRVR